MYSVAQSDFEIAQAFMSKKGITLVNDDKTATRGDVKPYSIFNGKGDKGFAIVVNGNVIGYSTENSADENHMPDGLRHILNSTYSSSFAYSYTKRDPIAPLVKTKWNQSAPYNLRCPVVGTQHCVTGCTATAIAQVLAYHKCPQEETTEIPGYDTYSSLPPTKFKWDDMLDEYKYNKYNASQADAVAELMHYVGHACGMKYGLNESIAAPLVRVCIDYFGYNKYSVTIETDCFLDKEIEDIIYSHLQRGLPIVVSGGDVLNRGHSYVIDGYDTDGYYHINWGWGGYLDGNFAISTLFDREHGLTDNTSDNIIEVNRLYIIIPNEKSMEKEDVSLIRMNATYGGSGVRIDYPESNVYRTSATVYRTSKSESFEKLYFSCLQYDFAETRKMDMTLGIYDGDKMIAIADDIFTVDCEPNVVPKQNGEYIHNVRLSFGKGLDDGRYQLRWISRINGTEQWFKAWSADRKYFDLTIEDNCATLKSVTIDPLTDIKAALHYNVTRNGDIYNLQGQKVGNTLEGLPKGVYIKDGKKQVVK